MHCSIITSLLLIGLGNHLWPLPNSSSQGKYDIRKKNSTVPYRACIWGRGAGGGGRGGRLGGYSRQERKSLGWQSPLKAQQRCSTRTPTTGTEAARCPPDATVAQCYTALRTLRGREGSGAGRILSGLRTRRAGPQRAATPRRFGTTSVPPGRRRPITAAFRRLRRLPTLAAIRAGKVCFRHAPRRPAAFCRHGGRARSLTRAPARGFCEARRAAPFAELFPAPSPQVRDGPGGRADPPRAAPPPAAPPAVPPLPALGAPRSAPRAVGAPRGRPVGPRGGGAGGGGGAEATSGRPRGARAGDGGGGTGVEAAALRRKRRRRRRRRRRDAGGGRGAAVVELLRAGGGGRRPEGCRGSGRWVCGRAGREVGREPRRREGSAAWSCRGAARKLRGAAMWGFGGVRESDGAPCPRPGASQSFM